MTPNEHLIVCIQAEERGERIEYRSLINPESEWSPKTKGVWNNTLWEYRIATKPRRFWVKWYEDKTKNLLWSLTYTDPKEPGWQLVEEKL